MWLINIHKSHNTQTEFRVFNSANVVDEIECVNEKGLEEIIPKHAIHKAVVVINGFGIYQSKKTLEGKNEKFFIQKYTTHDQVLYTAIKIKDLTASIFLLSSLGVVVTNVFIGDGLGVNMLTSNTDEASFGDSVFSILHNGEMKISKSSLNNIEYTNLFTFCVKQLPIKVFQSNVHMMSIQLRLLLIAFNTTTVVWTKRKWFIALFIVLVALSFAVNYGYKTTLEKKERTIELKTQEKEIEQDNAIKYQSIVGNLRSYNADRVKYLSVLLNDVFSGFSNGIEVKLIDAFPEVKTSKGQIETVEFSNSIGIEGTYVDFMEFEKWVSHIKTLPEVNQVVYNDFKKIKGDNNYSISIELTKNVR